MKKLVFLFALSMSLISCNKSERIVSAISKEIIAEPKVFALSDNKKNYTWENIDSSDEKMIKKTLEKTFGHFPVKSKPLSAHRDSFLYKYWLYETSSLSIELDYIYPFNKKYKGMKVSLFITEK